MGRAVEACRLMVAALEEYGHAISDLFGHDEKFLDAREAMGRAIEEDGHAEVTDAELLKTTDAHVWAKEFQKASGGKWLNTETVAGWFANAMMAARGADTPASRFKVRGTRTKTIKRDIVADSPQQASQKFYEATGIMPSWVDGYMTAGTCATCGEALFVGLPYRIDMDGKHYCEAHNPWRPQS